MEGWTEGKKQLLKALKLKWFYDPNDHSVYNFIPTLLIHIQLNRNCKLLVSSIKQTLHFKIPGH